LLAKYDSFIFFQIQIDEQLFFCEVRHVTAGPAELSPKDTQERSRLSLITQ